MIIRYVQGLQPVMGDDYIWNYKQMKDKVWSQNILGKKVYQCRAWYFQVMHEENE